MRGALRGGRRPPTAPARSVEHDDLADDLTLLQRGDGIVQVLEADATADQTLDVELAPGVEADQAREVAAQVRSPVHRRLQVASPEQQFEGVDRHLVVRRAR